MKFLNDGGTLNDDTMTTGKQIMIVWGWLMWASVFMTWSQPLPEQARVFRFLPEETIAVGMIPDLERTYEHLERIALTRYLSAQVPELFDLTEFPSRVWDTFHRSLVVVVSPQKRLDEAGSISFSDLEFMLLAQFDKGENSHVLALFEEIFHRIQAQEPTVEMGIFEFQGEQVYRIGNQQLQIYYSLIEDTCLVARDRVILQQAVQQSKQTALSESATLFFEAFADSARSDLYVAAKLSGLWPFLQRWILTACRSLSPLEQTLLVSWMECSQWALVDWKLSFEEDGIAERLRMLSFATVVDKHNMMSQTSSAGPGSSSMNFPFISDQLVSEHVIGYGATHLDLLAWWYETLRVMRASPEANYAEAFETSRKAFERVLQKPLETLWAELSPIEVGLAWYPPVFIQRRAQQSTALLNIPLVAILHTDLHHELEHAFHTWLSALQVPSVLSSFQGITIQTCQFPWYGETVAFSYAMIDDALVLSPSEALIRESIRVTRYGSALSENENYQHRAASFPAQSLSRGFFRWSEFDRLLKLYQQRQDFTEDDSINFMAPALPLMWVTTAEPGGVVTESRSSLGGTVTGMLVLWLTFLMAQ